MLQNPEVAIIDRPIENQVLTHNRWMMNHYACLAQDLLKMIIANDGFRIQPGNAGVTVNIAIDLADTFLAECDKRGWITAMPRLDDLKKEEMRTAFGRLGDAA